MTYLLTHPGVILVLLWQHLVISGVAVGFSALIAFPLGVLIVRNRRLGGPILGILGVIYSIPSIALIILLIPLFGLNARAVIVALILYAQVILVRNFAVGLQEIDPAIREAGKGMGMNGWQMLWKVEFPLALPVILAGLRIATVVAVGIATVGAKFGAGGLGTLLFEGIAQAGRYDKIWAGTIAVGALAIALNWGLLAFERRTLRYLHA